jgi:hypothetical protein
MIRWKRWALLAGFVVVCIVIAATMSVDPSYYH